MLSNVEVSEFKPENIFKNKIKDKPGFRKMTIPYNRLV